MRKMHESSGTACEGMEVNVPSMSDVTFKYTWKIRKYGKLRVNKDSFDSAPFECNANDDKTKWNLSIRYWKGKDGRRLESPIVMCLNLLHTAVTHEGQATVSFEFGVLNTKINQWEVCPRSRTLLYFPSTSEILSVGYRDLRISKQHLQQGTGTLTVYVKIQLNFMEEITRSNLQQDLAQLLTRAEATGDVTLQCAQDKIIRAHSHILSARSPVFSQLLCNGPGSILDLANLSEDLVQQMLEYIYTDHAEVTNNTTLLISIAHRFQLAGLKTTCENHLTNTINAANVPSLLMLAEQFECEKLKRAILNYCESNAGVIQKNMTWKVLEMVNPDLFEEVCEAGLGSSVSSNMDSLPSDPEA